MSDEYYDHVIRPCFVYRLREMAKTQADRRSRSRLQGTDLDKKLAENWSHDVILAQYATVARRMHDRTLANVLDATPAVASSVQLHIDRRQRRAPRRTVQQQHRADWFRQRGGREKEAEYSERSYAALKTIANRFR